MALALRRSFELASKTVASIMGVLLGQIRHQLIQNQYLAGVLVMGGGRVLVDLLRGLFSQVRRFIMSRLWTRVSLGVGEADDLREWLRAQPDIARVAHLRLHTRSDVDSDSNTADQRVFEYEPELATTCQVGRRVCFSLIGAFVMFVH